VWRVTTTSERTLAVLLAAATVLAVLTPAVGAADGTGIDVGLVGPDSASPTLVVTVDGAPAAGADVTVDPAAAGRTYGGTGDYRTGADGTIDLPVDVTVTYDGPTAVDRVVLDAGSEGTTAANATEDADATGDGSPPDDPGPPGRTGTP